MFSVMHQSTIGRRGRLTTAHGDIETPFFFPVATAGAMKGITLDHLLALGAQAILCNTYHLHIHPGEQTIADAGGLHRFMGWDKPILTDSGGFQVFSLSDIRSISDNGVTFRNHRNGSQLFLGPVESISIQHKLGSDIIMCFDECPPSTAPRAAQIAAVDRTLKWAKICKETHEKMSEKKKKSDRSKRNESGTSSISSQSSHSSLLFAIVQGGLERDLREKCAQELIAIGFDGYAVGGLAVGETEEEMYSVLDVVCPILPTEKPRYLMGVGELHQHREAVRRGIDMFDCVSPMREARHGNIWLSDGTKLRIRRKEYLSDHSVIDPQSPSPLSRQHLRSYLAHLVRIGERYGETIACLQNMAVTLENMRRIREAIESTNC